MAGRDLFPTEKADSRDRSSFHLGMGRNVELSFKHELNVLAKKSIHEIGVKKEAAQNVPLDEEQLTTRKLKPEFQPEKIREKRKTHPIFHDDPPKTSKGTRPSLPMYNALDREKSLTKLKVDKPKKYPIHKEPVLTTEEMKKPHVTSVGIVPIRDSEDVSGLNVVMQGKPAIPQDTDPVMGPVERANTLPSEPSFIEDLPCTLPPTPSTAYKPSILGQAGTLAPVALTQRPAPPAKPKTRLQRARMRSARSGAASSMKSVPIHLPDSKMYGKYDEAIADIDQEDGSRGSSVHTVKSTKDLLEEAKQLAGSTGIPARKRKASESKSRTDERKGKTSSRGEVKAPVVPQKVERSVDEIIASLKDGSMAHVETDADRRINEIMNRVVARTQVVLEAGGEEEMTDEDAQSKKDDFSAKMSPVPDQAETDEAEEEASKEPPKQGPPDIQSEIMKEALEKLAEMRDAPSDDVTDPTFTETETLGLGFEAVVEDDEDDEEEEEDMRTPTPDLEQAWQDLNAPSVVANEDVLNVKATKAGLFPKRAPSLLGSWGPAVQEDPEEPQEVVPPPQKKARNIHHFCTATDDIQLPDHMKGTWRKYHVPSKFDFLHSDKQRSSDSPAQPPAPTPVSASELGLQEALDRRQSLAARRILEDANGMATAATSTHLEDLEMWQERALQVFDKPEVDISGKKLQLQSDESFLHWTLAPPKWDAMPTKVKEVLFPEYHGAALAQDMDTTEQGKESDDSEIEEEYVPQEDPEIKAAKHRTLTRTYGSARDLTTLDQAKQLQQEALAKQVETEVDEDSSHSALTSTVTTPIATARDQPTKEATSGSDTERSLPPQRATIAEMRAQMAQQKVAAPTSTQQTPRPGTVLGVDLPVLPPIARPGSAPGTLGADDEEFLMVYQDFTAAMQEISHQKKQLRLFKAGKVTPPGEREEVRFEDEDEDIEEAAAAEGDVMEGEDNVQHSEESKTEEGSSSHKTPASGGSYFGAGDKADELTPAEQALAAGRSYVLLPPKKKKKLRKVDLERIEDIERFLARQPRRLQRSESLPRKDRVIERELRVPQKVRQRRGSLPDLLNFEAYKNRSNFMPEEKRVEREWVRGIWNNWFDQVYPPTPPESEWGDDESEELEEKVIEEIEEKPKRKTSVASTVYGDDILVYPVTQGQEDEEAVQMMEEEVQKLTDAIIAADQRPRAFDLCRRGAILRKLGKIGAALGDLDKAIATEPMLLDAYWHRHLVYRLQNKKAAALDDLNYVLKYNKTHAGAYRSRAAIHKEKNEITMAIVNFTQAIKHNPEDYEAYYQRAEMYEQRGELLLAMEDYAMATKICPGKTEALFKHAMHYFENGNWSSSISDFTEMLKIEPFNGRARMYRGRAYSMLKQWNPALEDLSAAIHLDPNNSRAYYYRGCLLRKLHPKKALQDFSVSLLIDDSEENHLAYLHRGILYNAIGKHEDAIPDFEACLKLDHQMASAHVNLGLIYMTKMDNHHRAIKKFTAAIKADPTYVKAYVCRAEAHTRVHDIKNALLDITRAIHLRPDVHHYYMYRGKLILQMGNLELAAFCVKHAAELNTGMAHSPTQEAIVQSFLKNYQKAIDALETAVKTKPVAPLYMLLGKTQMKARKWKGAVDSFQKALDLVQQHALNQPRKPWQDKQVWPAEAAEMYYLIGMCQIEERDYLNAHEAFNNAIKVNSKYSEAYYQRGLAKLRLKQTKGVQDFNRALALDPKLFQAYLSRAAYYGLKGQYTKAILNCNEAIKLQPNSIRAYLYRGALKYHIKAYTLAIRDLTQAIAIDSQCTLAYFNRAVCYQDSGDWQKALQDYGIVLLLGDHLALKVLINRGLLYYDRGDYQNALQDFLLAADVFPEDKNIHHTLGLCYHKLYKLEQAVISFTRALELDPFFLDALISRGNVFMDFGHDFGRMYARHDYERALHQSPTCMPARVNLAYTLQVAGKYQQAWHQFTAAIQIDDTYKPALEGRAIINLQMSDTCAAFQDINASCNVKPTAELLTNRGVIYQVLLKDAKGAISDFERAIKISPHSAHMYFNRGNLYTSLQQYDKAQKDYTKALYIQPDDPYVLKRRADVRGKLGWREKAVDDYRRAIEIQSKRKV